MGVFGDRRLRLAVEISLLVHLLLIWLLPQGHAALAALFPVKPITPAAEEKQQAPIRFELVDLPKQKAEAPSRPDAPGSDLSRRAHGGEGDPADRPSARGTTYDLRLSPQQAAQQQRAQVPPAQPETQPSPNRQPSLQPSEPVPPADEGAGSVMRARPQPTAAPQSKPVLKGLAPLSPQSVLGGAAPDRKGGQVDLGPLSFDTQWYDWGPYAAEMLRRIRYHWNIPEIAQFGVQGKVRVHFSIGRDGKVSGVEILSESGHPPMDFAARDAIINASPLPPLPSDLTGVDKEGVTITFYYNVRPPDDGDDGR